MAPVIMMHLMIVYLIVMVSGVAMQLKKHIILIQMEMALVMVKVM